MAETIPDIGGGRRERRDAVGDVTAAERFAGRATECYRISQRDDEVISGVKGDIVNYIELQDELAKHGQRFASGAGGCVFRNRHL